MFGFDVDAAVVEGQLLTGSHHFLRFNREIVEVHMYYFVLIRMDNTHASNLKPAPVLLQYWQRRGAKAARTADGNIET